MIKVHKSCDICDEDIRPVVLSLGEQSRSLVRGSLHFGRPAAAGCAAGDFRASGGPAGTDGTSGSSAGGPTAAALPEQIRQAADLLISQASGEAVRLIREARQQAVEIGQEAYAAGYDAGQRQAQIEQEAHSRQLSEQMAALADDIEQRNRQQLDQLEPEVLELSLQVAEKIIGRELSRNDEAFRSLVRSALGRLKQSERVCVRVSESDVCGLGEGIAAGLPVADCVQVMGESRLPAGSCLIDSDSGLMDASVPVQLRRIRETLQEGCP